MTSKNSSDDRDVLSKQLLDSTPARIMVGRSGTRPTTEAWLKFRYDHAIARDSVRSELSEAFVSDFIEAHHYPICQSQAVDRADYILNPPKGKVLGQGFEEVILDQCPQNVDVQIVVGDGLSALAVEANVPDLLPMLVDGCKMEGFSMGKPVFVRFARVAIADQIGSLLNARVAVNLIGERPGLSSAVGLSAYITYGPGSDTVSSHRTVVSNICSKKTSSGRPSGTPPTEAGAYIIYLLKKIFENSVSGVELQKLL